jgi:dephospho-CoA kinase
MPVDGKPIIGVLGGIGSGKSTVARLMADRFGGMRIDADADAKAALDEPDVRDQLIAWWGASVLNEQGRIDRQAVASIVFDDEAERKRLESMVHPKVAEKREAKLAEAAGDPSVRFVVLDVPLLAEVGLSERCDALVFVEADWPTRLERVRQSRGWDEAELARREKNQMPLDRKRDLAHYVVRNDASEAECLAQVREVVSRILDES